MRSFLTTMMALLAVAFCVQGCSDLSQDVAYPVSQKLNSKSIDAAGNLITDVGPAGVAYALLTSYGVNSAEEMALGIWDYPDQLESWNYIDDDAKNDAGDSTAVDPWDTILGKFGRDTNHTGSGKSNDPPATPAADPWDTINEKFFKDSTHTGKKPKPKNGGDPPAADPWDTIQEKFGRETNHTGKKTKAQKRQEFNSIIEGIEGDHGFGEALLLAVLFEYDIVSPGEMVDRFNEALVCCSELFPDAVHGDLFLAPFINIPDGSYTVLSSAGDLLELESENGKAVSLATLTADQFLPGDQVVLFTDPVSGLTWSLSI